MLQPEKLQLAQLIKMHVGKPEHTFSEADVLETFYSEEDLAQPALRMRYESAKEDRTVAELVRLIYVLPAFAAAAKCVRLTDQMTRAINSDELSKSFSPAEFIIWARANGIAWPEQLKRAFQELDEIPNLRAERDALRRECDKLRAALKESEKKNNPKWRTKTLQMLYGIAQCKYGHDHRRAKSSAPPLISEDLRRVGIRIDPDTIRERLHEAIEELPENWDSDNPL